MKRSGTLASEVELSAVSYDQAKSDLMKIRNANRDDVRDEKYFNWRYLGRPGGQAPVIVMARDRQGETVGALALIPHLYWINDALAPVGLLGDISVDEAWRGKRIAQQMMHFLSGLDAVRELRYCMVLPNEAATRSLQKSGWSDVSRLDRSVRIVSIERELRRRSAPAWLAKILSFGVTPVYERIFRAAPPDRSGAYEAAVLEEVHAGSDELWGAIDKNGMVMACRDSDHLAWRFIRHPIKKYRFFVLTRDGVLQGYVAYHVRGEHCHIDDVLCRREPDLAAYLLYRFVLHQREAGAVNTVAVQINRNYASQPALTRVGFSRRRDFQRVMIKPRDDVTGDLAFLNGMNWFVTSGDKDV
jgi:GNAT superfamily N-acetyltransferase